MGALKRARTAYNKAEEEWTFFTEQEEPAFQRWLVIKCGPLWSRTRELTEQIQYHRHLLYRMELEALYSGDSDAACYERAKDRLKHPEKYSDEYERDELDQDDVDEDHNWNPFGDAWHMDDAEDWRPDIEAPVEAAPSPPIAAEVRSKSIYRELSRRLHPDANSETTAEQRELWYQVQLGIQYLEDELQILVEEIDSWKQAESDSSGTPGVFEESILFEVSEEIPHRTCHGKSRRSRSHNEHQTEFQFG